MARQPTRPAARSALCASSWTLAASERLRQQAAAAGVSLFHLLLASYAGCLATWSEARAVAINVADSGRGLRLPNIERLVGCCADQIPLLLRLEPGEELAALASRVRDQWLAAQQHSAVSALDLARLRPARRGAILRSPGAATFSFARFALEPPDDCPVTIEAVDAITGSAATRLTLLAWELGGALHFAWIYPEGSFRHETIAGLAAAHRESLVDRTRTSTDEQDVEEPDQPMRTSTDEQDVEEPDQPTRTSTDEQDVEELDQPTRTSTDEQDVSDTVRVPPRSSASNSAQQLADTPRPRPHPGALRTARPTLSPCSSRADA